MKVINFFASPSVGKSTIAAGLFYKMKISSMSVELVTETAKDLVWDDIDPGEAGQDYLFGMQNRRIHRLRNKVDYVITDSPILIPVIYRPIDYPRSFDTFALDMFDTYTNINFLLTRDLDNHFETKGRVHNKAESLLIQNRIINFLEFHRIKFNKIDLTNDINMNKNNVSEVLNIINDNRNV
jgi:hypothetical protein